jgi:ferredoxin
MKVSIDRSGCVSCGSCWDTCPAVFEQNPDDSFSQIVEKYRIGNGIADGEVLDDQKACVSDAAALCPTQIIQIE